MSPCGCGGKRSQRLAAKKAVVANATPPVQRPAVWTGESEQEEETKQ